MKKIIVCALVGICFLALPVIGVASADDSEKKKSLFDYVQEEYDVAEFKPFGVFGGFLKGGFYKFKDFSHETYRFLTFNIEDDNKGGFDKFKDIAHETYRFLTFNTR